MTVTIFERDKERGGDIVLTMATTNDADRVQKSSGPFGEGQILSYTALFLLDIVKTMSRRHALYMTKFGTSKTLIIFT